MSTKHRIFTRDPKDFFKFVDKYVEVETNETKISGKLYTIDPVSESIILMRKNEETGAIMLEIILETSIENIRILSHLSDSQTSLDTTNLFQCAPFVSQDYNLKKERLKQWFTDNLVPLKDENDVLKLFDCLDVYPPYNVENCLSTNEIVLERVQKLMASMPSSTRSTS